MIHHWVGAVFIPGAKLDDVLAVLQDYDQHAEYYAPDVERSKIESRDGDHFRVFLRFRRHKVITVVLDTEHDVHYFRDVGDARAQPQLRDAHRRSRKPGQERRTRENPRRRRRLSVAHGNLVADGRSATAAFTCRAKWFR